MPSPSHLATVLLPISNGLIDALLAEDAALGDLTTRALGIGAVPAHITFTARDDQIASGTEEAVAILERLGASIRYILPSGSPAPSGTLLIEATGSASMLHLGWKSAQTLMEWCAGIATTTHSMVTRAKRIRPTAVVACTRKAAPLTRSLAIRAVLAGGGVMHRINLSETVLVFPEHLAFIQGKTDQAIEKLRQTVPERKITIEVDTIEQAISAAKFSPDVLQLEKFSPQQIAELRTELQFFEQAPILAAAGGINPNNITAYMEAGADIIVTSAPYSAKPCDVQVHLKPE
ncbi:ModD protein [Zymomonas mobilis]|uniref:Putative pyrophosphorylase ModD n=1 Tax=Zymomonas mobilis subsp. pomaceae (strain ATCC 29192 / DSM 22645 / JCM 10191 / CCUG 17912 / NBRC 13757 / NCIMB 11200 / NRRL B-4491 / Barker I) TaxID=579138 RepID=F8EUP0_ZYMMT|nr:ModD protein [Zymomonas mobilis]AEI38186.1 modD protein [Zymomonas mobilis subsp. pomaceae ATCC 29192]MDX5947876.1 ModD protein [Zymomonas mobilis subsp. pomaceae]GEB89960.1 ModD protein [Zymomonas mobilis subsp. pomaceae]